MEKNYDPTMIMMAVALRFQPSVCPDDNFADYRIKINLIDKTEPLLINRDPNRKDGLVSIVQNNKVLVDSFLENHRNQLGAVSIFYKGAIHKTYESYEAFLKENG